MMGVDTAESPQTQRTWKPTVAGILDIICGTFGLLSNIIILIVLQLGIYTTVKPPWIPFQYVLLFAPFIINGLALAGGIFAIRRKRWGLALAGSIAAFINPYLFCLGVAAIILTILSKNEFEQTRHRAININRFIESGKPPKRKIGKPEIAGMLDIIGGLTCGIIAYNETLHYTDPATSVPLFVIGLIAIAGGIFSISKTIWGMAMAGPVALLWGTGWVVMLLISWLLYDFVGYWTGGDADPSYLSLLKTVATLLFGLAIATLILTTTCKSEFK